MGRTSSDLHDPSMDINRIPLSEGSRGSRDRYAPENRKTDGCFFNFEGPKNITISRLKDVLQGPVLSLSKERKYGLTYLQRMNIPHTALERSVQYLSGGNQQKVIVARWLFSQARLLIMDEPTQGIDIGAKLEVYNVINELTAAGISIILISSDFPSCWR
jgi:ribose transport system ATP-binding protein